MDIPPQITEKFKKNESEAFSILEEANEIVSDFDASSVQFRVSSTAPLPLLTINEQAQSMAFIVRYDHLPVLNSFVAGRHPDGRRYFLNEIDQVRAALNEYRTIFFNNRDGIHYGAITNLYQRAFNRKSPHPSMKYEAILSEGADVSDDYLNHLKTRKKAIQHAIGRSDFDYIFNGVLQHSDGQYSKRMVKEYTDGSLQYTLLKNLFIAQGLKDLLSEHYKVINVMNFPKMGAL
jgi:hypothetical protein